MSGNVVTETPNELLVVDFVAGVFAALAAVWEATAVTVLLLERVLGPANAPFRELTIAGSIGAMVVSGGLFMGSFGTAGTMPIPFPVGDEFAAIAVDVAFDLARPGAADGVVALEEVDPPRFSVARSIGTKLTAIQPSTTGSTLILERRREIKSYDRRKNRK